MKPGLCSAAVAAALALTASQASAAILFQQTVDVPGATPGNPVDVDVSLVDLPLGYIGVNHGTITNASWNMSTIYYALWWSPAWWDPEPGARFLDGNDYFAIIGPGVNTPQRYTAVGVDISGVATLANNVLSFNWSDQSQPVDFCDQPDLPFYETCAGGERFPANALADGFTVNVDQSFTWTVYDQLPVPVPEPATWALLISGLGLAGAALRRRFRLSPATSGAGS